METSILNKLTFSVIIGQFVITILTLASFIAFRATVLNVKREKVKVSDELIATNIRLATSNFLERVNASNELMLASERQRDTVHHTFVDGVCYGNLRGNYLLHKGSSFGNGDIVNANGTNVWVDIVDFERQRVYGHTKDGQMFILSAVPTMPSAPEGASARGQKEMSRL